MKKIKSIIVALLLSVSVFSQITIVNGLTFVNIVDGLETTTLIKPIKVIIDTDKSIVATDNQNGKKLIYVPDLQGFTYSDLVDLQSQLMDYNTDPVITADYLVEVSKGNVPGAYIVHKFGHNGSIGTTLSVMANAGVYQMPMTADSIEVLSTSASDDVGSTGIDTIRIEGINSEWNDTSINVPMNGLFPSPITTKFRRIYRVYGVSSGTYGSTTTPSQGGNITIRGHTGGVSWVLLNGVSTYAHSQSQIGAYTVPEGCIAYLLNTFIHVDANKTVDMLLFQRQMADDVVSPYEPVRLVTEFRGVEGSRALALKTPRRFPEKTDLFWLASVASGTADAAIDFEILIIKDE